MPDTVSTQIIRDGTKHVVIKLTNISDGTGESLVKKIDAPNLTPIAKSLSIQKIWYNTNMVVTLFWEATTNVRIVDLSGDGCMDLSEFSGIPNNAGAGVTGSILLTTTGHASGKNYSIIIKALKNI